MKIFPASFVVEKNRTDGPSPIWILKISVNSVDYYLSDVVVSVPGWSITTKAWIKSWGNLTEGVTGLVDEFKVSDFSATCIKDPAASPDIVALALEFNLEKEAASLYLWFADSTDDPQEMFRGYIHDYPISDGDTVCTLQLQDESIKWQETYVGRKLSLADYPGADPDDVGKTIPIPYGTVIKVPALAIDAGIVRTLAFDYDAASNPLFISDSAGLAGKQITIDEETLLVGSVVDNECYVTRGYAGTTAAWHNSGASVAEKKSTPLVYIAADLPIDSFGRVNAYVDKKYIDITVWCSLYTGQTGNEHASYPGKAIVTIADFVKVKKQVTLANDASGLSVDEGTHDHPATLTMVTVPLETASIQTTPVSSPELAVDGSWTTCAILNNASSAMYVTRQTLFSAAGTPTRYMLCFYYKDGTGSMQTSRSSWTYLSSWEALTGLTRIIYGHASIRYVYSAWLEVEYDPTVATAPASGVSLSGNSYADTVVGSSLYVDMTRTMASPLAVFADLLSTWAGLGSFGQSGLLPDSYRLDFVINDYRRLPDWLHDLAWQCRSWLRISRGEAMLTVRQTLPEAVKTLASCHISDGKRLHSRDKSAYSEVINAIDLLYDRDWTQSKSDKAYSASVKDVNAISIADFGRLERPELFQLEAVTDPDHAADLLEFYLLWYSVRHWLHIIETDYRDCELDFSDPVIIGFAGGVNALVMTADINPGADSISLKLIQ